MKIAIVIPNLNGEDYLSEAVDSLLDQSLPLTLIVVDNASHDRSLSILESYGDRIILLKNDNNMGFTGGVNPGMQYAIDHDFDAVALLNNDAVADKYWLENLAAELQDNVGVVTGRLESFDKTFLDTTGECMSEWGLSYPRGRGSSAGDMSYDHKEFVFGATGGASLYSVAMLRDIGLFDQDFFAYYEDVDICFRAQLVGWKVVYTPKAIAYHRISQTSRRMYKGFSVFHSFKNMPLLLHKNLPSSLKKTVLPRFWLAYSLFFMKSLVTGKGQHALKGYLAYRKLKKKSVRSSQKVSSAYLSSLFTAGPPPDSSGLQKLVSPFRRNS